MSAKKILVGIGGGIAAYKMADTVSRLVRAGHLVNVCMTRAAREFVGPATFAALTRNPVRTELFPAPDSVGAEAMFPHIYPAADADLFLLGPATADLMARVAHGFGDDIVCCSALSLRADCAKLFCPAMNERMWAQPTVWDNVRQMEDLGWIRIGPHEGRMACGSAGPGRMAEPSDIFTAVEQALAGDRSLAGKTALILSGPTREHLDPVRFLGNGGSGRMGRALAEAAAALGATVDFVTGPVAPERLPSHPSVRLCPVVSAAQMLDAARERAASADVLIFAASVADFRPVQALETKRPKSSKPWTLDVEPTPDVAAEIIRTLRGNQVAVGFALESEDGRARAAKKLAAKGFSAIVVNGPDAMDADEADYLCLVAGKSGPSEEVWGRLTKRDCARRILSLAAELGAATTGNG